MVDKSDTATVSYNSSVHASPEIFHHHGSLGPPSNAPLTATIDFKVTSPLFYTQLVRYAHLTEFFSTSILTTAPEAQTFFISDPQKLLRLFEMQMDQNRWQGKEGLKLDRNSHVLNLRWRFLRWLRAFCSSSSSDCTSRQSLDWKIHDIRALPLSELDQFVMQHSERRLASQYRRAVVKVIASNLIAFGQPALIDTFSFAVRISLLWAFVRVASSRYLFSHHDPTREADLQIPIARYWPALRAAFGLLGLHFWAALENIW